MNAPSAIANQPTAIQPLARIVALVARMRPAFPECALSLGLLWEWTMEHLAWLRERAADVRAIDDEMERVAPELWDCLQNDPPGKRKRIWQAWQATHARTEQRAADLTPPKIPH